jgi:serine/threonine protein phosphatase PrpC
MKFAIYQESRRGGRKNNQDRLGYSFGRESLLVVVADGMGGHLHGEVAAQVTVELITQMFQKHSKGIIPQPFHFLKDAICRAHDAILSYAANHHLLETPRTTVVAALLQDNMIYWAHVGDSRLYFVQSGQLTQMMRDHSKVQQMLDHGEISAAEAAVHPERNKIYNCLGSMYPPEVELGGKLPLLPGDGVLLCTDGLWGELKQDEIVQFIGQYPAQFALPQLMDRAELRGGKHGDNLSAIGVTWMEDDDSYDAAIVSTQKLPLHAFTTQINALDADASLANSKEVSEDDIEAAIAEIQAAIRKYSK